MQKICVATGSRADYHLLAPTIARLKDHGYGVDIVVTGSHLLNRLGQTYKQIEADGNAIACKISILGEDDVGSPSELDHAMGKLMAAFDDYLCDARPDLCVILGDRYEMLPIAIDALMHRIPIAHLHGGEKTVGAIDDSIRNAITKMATLHFTSCEAYRRRIIQMGENPDRVFNVGACGIENIKHVKLWTKKRLLEDVGLTVDEPFLLVTYHPTTLGAESAGQEAHELLAALDQIGMPTLFTLANADAGGVQINSAIHEYVATHGKTVAVASLGMTRYLSALNSCAVVVGNSSSGILEAPSFHVPTVNIGTRQEGRIRAASVIDCPCQTADIVAAIQRALTQEFRAICREAESPYGDGNVSSRVVEHVEEFFGEPETQRRTKVFFDVDFKF